MSSSAFDSATLVNPNTRDAAIRALNGVKRLRLDKWGTHSITLSNGVTLRYRLNYDHPDDDVPIAIGVELPDHSLAVFEIEALDDWTFDISPLAKIVKQFN